MHRTKIVYLITGLDTGGAEMMLYRLVKYLPSTQYDITVASLLPPGPVGEKIKAAGVSVYSVNMSSKFDVRAAWRLLRLIKQNNPDILHTHLFHANLLGHITGKLAGVPVIISSIRNTVIGGRARELLLRYTVRWATVTTTICRAAQTRMVNRGIVSESKLRVIYNGIDPGPYMINPASELKAQAREELGFREDRALLLSAGRLQKQKGYPYLLQAAGILKDRGYSFYLAIAGEGELKAALEQQVQILNLEDHVRFLGLRNDMPRLMNIADIFVLSSLWEGLPGVILEAMAAGLPVVSTSAGGAPELVVEGETGFLVPPRDPAAMAGALAKLLDLPREKITAMGSAGQRRVQEQYRLDKMAAAYEELYAECLSRQGISEAAAHNRT